MHVLVADGHDLVRETIAAFLLAEGMARVGTAATLAEVLDRLAAEPLDLVLIDDALPGMHGLEGLARAVAGARRAGVALVSGSTARDLALAAMDAGARGFVPKKMGARAMVAAVRLMGRGERFLPMGILTADGPQPSPAIGSALGSLTPREGEVLRGVCEGKSNKEIARDLSLQEVTVKVHVKTLSRKLGARNRTHAAMIARRVGFA